jgi:hypothetical protein
LLEDSFSILEVFPSSKAWKFSISKSPRRECLEDIEFEMIWPEIPSDLAFQTKLERSHDLKIWKKEESKRIQKTH